MGNSHKVKRLSVTEKVVLYIEENLHEEIGLEQIADFAGYSGAHLNRLFAEEVGCTIHRYILGRRLTAAAEQLAKTDLPISEIALEAGYQSQQAFTFAFKKLYHYTPQSYRKRGYFTVAQPRFTEKIQVFSPCPLLFYVGPDHGKWRCAA